MTIVLDASAGVTFILDKAGAPKIANTLSSADVILAPELYINEITNVFWKYHHLEGMSINDCEQGIDRCIGLPDDYIQGRELYKEAFSMACLTNSTAYDMVYLVIARRNNATLLTVDTFLLSLCEKYNIRVINPV